MSKVLYFKGGSLEEYKHFILQVHQYLNNYLKVPEYIP